MSRKNKNTVNVDLSQPWLSIVVPIYNGEKFLSKCLNAIAKQTFTDFEVILIDDGSTDRSSDICQKYALNDKRFRYFRKENGGAFQSRIYGVEKAAGTYITFCDADDFYANKNVFACLYEEIMKSNCQAIQFGFMKKYNHLSHKVTLVKTPLDTDRNTFNAHEYPKLLCSYWNEAHLTTNVSNKVYHCSLISSLPSSKTVEKVFWGDDQIMNLYLLSECESFRFIPDALYCYRQMSGDTSRFSLHTMEDVDNIKKYQLMFLKHYQGNVKQPIKQILFSELAGWFFYYIQQALDYLDEEELILLINNVLQYPRFILAREYFMKLPQAKWDSVNLLRKADAKEYIQKAKEYHANRKLKDTVKEMLKQIYAII